MSVYLATVANQLKDTLDEVLMDSERNESDLIMPKYMHMRRMTDAYHDDLDFAGPGLASLKPEGQQIAVGSLTEGTLWTYVASMYAIRLVASREVLADSKYKKAIDLAHHNRDAIWNTVEYEAANVLIRRSNSSYLGGDGVTLASASHPVTRGGTFSNVAGTPLGPSYQGLVLATADLKQMVGRDGLKRPIKPTKVVHPTAQWAIWAGLLESDMRPEPGNFSEINVLKRLKITSVEVPHWDTADNDWCLLTSADRGLTWRWREKPFTQSWVDHNVMAVNASIGMRFAVGWSDPRGVFWGGTTS